MGAPVSGLFFVAATFVITFGAYVLARRWMRATVDEDSHELASSMVFRVAAMHGLILGLVFAEELSNLNAIKAGVVREANQLEGIYNDLELFAASGGGQGDVAAIQQTMKLYVGELIANEWTALNQEGNLSTTVSGYWRTMFRQLLALPASGDQQTWLRDRMLTKIDAIGLERDNREVAATTDISPTFWIVAFAGLAAIAAPYYVFRPNRVTMFLLVLYAAYVAVVLYFINMFDYPFSGFGLVRPAALELFYNEFLQGLPDPPAASGT
ncbi:MAG: DUF4239 domain-containing protein [Hyphomicrobiales bacterium]|nr:DUF4239 domain-containing protein [Hyphomicrobiales bacterium]